jgi:hypothetical protein
LSHVSIIDPTDRAAWNALVAAGPALPGHHHALVTATASTLGGVGRLWHWQTATGRALCAIIERPVAGGGIDLVTPIGFSGLSWTGDPTGLAEAWTTSWRERGAIAAYLQLHPFGPPQAWDDLWAGVEPGLRPGPTTYVWDLSPSLHDLEQGLGRDHKLRLRKWRRTHGHISVDSPRLPHHFADLYATFADSRGVGDAYRLPPDTLVALATDPSVLAVGAADPGQPVQAVSLFPYRGPFADYFLNGAAPDGRHHARGLIWTAMTLLRERGVRWLNLGGGVRPGDDLDRFKQRFGGRPVDTPVLCQVFDSTAYTRACAQHGVLPESASGYFPAYRRPVP